MADNKNILSSDFKFLMLTAFIEGGAVMAVELLGAKMIAPYYGQSLYVWATVIALTLGGLTAGYFIGGILSEKYSVEKTLFTVILISAFLVGIMPFLASKIMTATLDMGLKAGIITSCIIFLFPPLVCFGMVSPLIIRLISTAVSSSGRSAGTVYAISTLGGILVTFLMGFYLIPFQGLKFSAYLTSAVLFIIPLIYFVRNKMVIKTALLFFLLLFIAGTYRKISGDYKDNFRSYIRVLYRNDGLLGQLLVADDLKSNSRSLLINNVSQSFMKNNTQRSVWHYVHRLATYTSVKPEGSDVLLAGMGGGLLVKELLNLKFDLDVVELDERMFTIARDYFGVSGNFNVTADDFRHYTKTCKKKYDIVIIDISFGENQPSYIYSQECFNEIKGFLKEDGFFFIHFPDALEDEQAAAKSIGKTLESIGFHTRLINTKPRPDMPSELIFIATKTPVDLTVFNYNRQPEFAKQYNFPLKENLYLDNVTFDQGRILTDDKPMMDFLHEKTVMAARKDGMEIITKTLLNENYNIF